MRLRGGQAGQRALRQMTGMVAYEQIYHWLLAKRLHRCRQMSLAMEELLRTEKRTTADSAAPCLAVLELAQAAGCMKHMSPIVA